MAISRVTTLTDNPITLQALLDQQAAALTEDLMNHGMTLPGPVTFTLQGSQVYIDYDRDRPSSTAQ